MFGAIFSKTFKDKLEPIVSNFTDIKNLIDTLNDNQLASNGYQKLPGGLIFQWGQTGNIADNGTLVVNFPIAFPNNALRVIGANFNPSTGNIGIVNVQAISPTTATLRRFNGGANSAAAQWFAIGY